MSRAIIKADSDFDILHQDTKFREVLKRFTRDEDILLQGTTRDWLVVNHPYFDEEGRNALDFKYEKEGWEFVIDYGSQRYYRNKSRCDLRIALYRRAKQDGKNCGTKCPRPLKW